MSMAAGLINSEKTYKSFHRRNNSGELAVFEASRYFSGYNEAIDYNSSTSFTQKMIMREERHGHKGRMSLDVPVRNLLPQQFHGVVMGKQMKEKKNSKQPSSPGGRLASFLNSLFSQSASKKKKKSSKSSSQSMKDEDESPGGRRRRRSSISHFRSSSSSTTTNADSNKSIYSSLSSGFRTPPYIQTPTKGCREFKSSSEQKPAVSLSKCNGTSQAKSSAFQDDQLLWNEKKKRNLTWLEENQKYVNGVSEKHRNLGNEFSEKEKIWVGKYFPEEKEFRKFSTTEVDIDDGAESDSSSDLFELQNYDLGYCSSGLPVYETTNADSIKRTAATISNGPL